MTSIWPQPWNPFLHSQFLWGTTWKWKQILYSSLTLLQTLKWKDDKRKIWIKGAKIELKSKRGGKANGCQDCNLPYSTHFVILASRSTLPLKLSGPYILVSDLHLRHFLCCCLPLFLPPSHLCCPLPPVFLTYVFFILLYNSEEAKSDPEVFLPQLHRCKMSLKTVEDLQAIFSVLNQLDMQSNIHQMNERNWVLCNYSPS